MNKYDNKKLDKWLYELMPIISHKQYDFSIKKSIQILDVIISFDIETTSTYLNGDKFAYMYEWTLGIKSKDKQITFYGRYWREFLESLETIKSVFKLKKNKRECIIWVHNLSFEFQFFRKYFKELQVFAVKDRTPIKVNTGFFIFRDTYILSAMSLAKVAENLTSHKIEKLVGDLDYNLVRNPSTYLTEKELKYCEYDVLIVMYYIEEQIKMYGDITKIPLTNTGRVRDFVRNKCFYTSKTHRKSSAGKYNRYKKFISALTLNEKEYMFCVQAFAGGFTHANSFYVGDKIENVNSIDFTSSYPAVMLSEKKFAVSSPEQIKITSRGMFYDNIKAENMACLFMVTFHDLQQVFPYESYLSESKAIELEEKNVNNGRLFSAKKATFIITDTDFKIIEKVYKWSSMTIHDFYRFYTSYLPKQIILSTLELYGKKTKLKNVQGKELEYLVSKQMLNSIYGMMVTAIIRDDIVYENGWARQKANIQEQLNAYNDNKKRFLYYQWGIQITASARYNLWSGILNIADDYIYSDTDSIKFLDYEKHLPYIEEYNKNVTNKIKKMCDYYNIDFELTRPKTIKGKEKPIGVWDYEGKYEYFKTLGAKRYIYTQDGKLHITIAGLNKKEGAKFLESQKDSYRFFNNDLYVPSDKTGKNTHTYIDDVLEGYITDYQGKTEYIKSLSGLHLEKASYTLSMAERYIEFLRAYKNGYIMTYGI